LEVRQRLPVSVPGYKVTNLLLYENMFIIPEAFRHFPVQSHQKKRNAIVRQQLKEFSDGPFFEPLLKLQWHDNWNKTKWTKKLAKVECSPTGN
jgi:hypothetical protein